MALWRRAPRLLGSDDLPEGFSYPPDLVQLVKDNPLQHWEWLGGDRLRRAATNLWKHHPRHLVPVAVRHDTTFVVCLDADRVHDGQPEVVTIDALAADAAPVQHLPTLAHWVAAAREEDQAPRSHPVGEEGRATGDATASDGEPDDEADGEPDDEAPEAPRRGWTPRETGACGCVHHLDPFLPRTVPFAARAEQPAAPRTVGDLLLAGDLAVEAEYPGPELALGNRPIGPFHWRLRLGPGARQHYDDDGLVPPEAWLMPNPGVGWVARTVPADDAPSGTLDLHLWAPDLCRDGVLTLGARMLLDDRARRRRGR